MEQNTDSQYDDDLTLGDDEYGDEYQSDEINLFEYGGETESPISRLKTLVLSIDWEITDEVLQQFNEEIVDLKDIWADDKVRMVYLQALEKLSRYIYRDKADAHPNAIKLLLGMYHNLEKVVLSPDLKEDEQRRLLLSDVEKFEHLKVLISQAPGRKAPMPQSTSPSDSGDHSKDAEQLIDLKAIVLGIDWEITEKDLLDLRTEVIRLDDYFANSRPKIILLQGLGILGAYIRKKKSNSHVDAFKLLHSFYEGLESIVRVPMSREEEKNILFPLVDKFNDFKAVVMPTLSDEEQHDEDDDEPDYDGTSPLAPAFAELPENGTQGFQEDVEVANLNSDSKVDVDSHIANFFGDDKETEVMEPAAPGQQAGDESVEPLKDSIEEVEALSEEFFGITEDQPHDLEVDKDIALQGVDVETEADDDSDEEALPVQNGEIAPALAAAIPEGTSSEVLLDSTEPEDEIADEITSRLDNFFAETGDEPKDEATLAFDVPADVAMQGVAVETPADQEADETPLDDIAPAFAGMEETPEDSDKPLSGSGIFGDPAEEDEPEEKEILTPVVEADEPVALEEFEPVTAALSDADIPDIGLEEDIELEVEEATVESRLDSMFPVEAEDTLLNSEAADAPAPTEEAVAFISEDDQEQLEVPVEEEPAGALEEEADETVVFELAEEDEIDISEPPGELAIEAEIDDYPAAQADEAEVEPAAAAATAIAASAAAASAAAASVAATGTAVAALEAETEPKDLSDLRDGIQSIGLDLDDSVIQGIFKEINSLRQQWVDHPLQKSYLQLLSTVMQHVDQYRYEASAESHELLVGLEGGLENSLGDPDKAQEQLLTDTYKILQWQQNMLNRQAVKKDGHLSFADPVRSEQSEETETTDSKVEEALLEGELYEDEEGSVLADTQAAVGPGILGDDDASLVQELEEVLNEEIEEIAESQHFDVKNGEFKEVVRQEIDSLRKTLQDEIADLRKALKESGEKE